MASLNEEETAAMNDLLGCYQRIGAWGLVANTEELAHAVHTIQHFIIQHMLGRINPDEWSKWYEYRIS